MAHLELAHIAVFSAGKCEAGETGEPGSRHPGRESLWAGSTPRDRPCSEPSVKATYLGFMTTLRYTPVSPFPRW